MSEYSEYSEENVSSEATLLLEKLKSLEPEEARYQVIRATIQYKTSWLELASWLNKVADEKLYKDWGYKTFRAYCASELFISAVTAKKLVRGFQWLDEQAPELLPSAAQLDDTKRQRLAPDMDTVQLLMGAQREVDRERLPQDAYAEIKRRAIAGELDMQGVRQELKESLLPAPEEPGGEPLKVLRRALATTEKIVAQLEALESEDEEIIELAARLRDRIFDIVSRKMEQLATLDGPGVVEDPGASTGVVRVEEVRVMVGAKEDFI